MNIFYFSSDPVVCARETCDKHLIAEIMHVYALLHNLFFPPSSSPLSSDLLNLPLIVRRNPTPISAVLSIWLRKNPINVTWTFDLLENLCKEYTLRYGKVHKVEREYLDTLRKPVLDYCPKYMYTYDISPPPRIMNTMYRVKVAERVETLIPQSAYLRCRRLQSILSYRNYLRSPSKSKIATWKLGAPDWFARPGLDERLLQEINHLLTHPRQTHQEPYEHPQYATSFSSPHSTYWTSSHNVRHPYFDPPDHPTSFVTRGIPTNPDFELIAPLLEPRTGRYEAER